MTAPPNRARTARLARDLLDAESLHAWTFRINGRMTSRFGLCRFDREEIHLAAWLVDRAPWPDVEDTLRHEVAHAVVGRGHGHGRAWKRVAGRLGARPVRCGDPRVWADHAPAALRPPRWIVVCEACGVRFTRQRRPRTRMAHGTCGRVVRWVLNRDGLPASAIE